MKCLQIIGTLDPRYGGPVAVINNLSGVLMEMGHEVTRVTLDAPGVPWLLGGAIDRLALGPSFGKYRYNLRLGAWLGANIRRFDAVIVHGIWQYQSLAVWYAARKTRVPYFVFIHGALDPWFKSTFPLKQVKKWLYWPWAEYRVLRDAAGVIFTCEEERLLARQSFWLYRINGVVVDHGILDPQGDSAARRKAFFKAYPNLGDKRILLFISRIHRKKGLDLLIEAFAQVAGRDPRLHLVVAGPDQEGSQQQLTALAEKRGVGGRITWTGMLTGDVKWGAYHAAEVFCLPSHSENFGIVVGESLALGVPVLISDKVNIWREIHASGAGLVAPDTVAGTLSMLEHWLGLDELTRQRMAECARKCFLERFEIHKTAESLMRIIEAHIRTEGKGVTDGATTEQEESL